MNQTIFAALFLSSVAMACSSAPSGPAASGDDAGNPSGDDASTSTSSSVSSADICSFFLAKDCPGAENTPAHQTACVQAYDVAATRGCEPFIEKGWACLATKGASALTCEANDVYVTDPTCAESGTVMAKCVGAVNDPQCYGGSCKSYTDCPAGWSCNETLGQCYDNSHECLGAPCASFTDCSAGTTCNSALQVCTKN